MEESSNISTLFRTLFLISFLLDQLRLCAGAEDRAERSYDTHHGATGPMHSKKTNSSCGNDCQSPIDIILDNATYTGKIPAITFDGYDEIRSDVGYALSNIGHTVQLSISGGRLTIGGAGLPGQYQLVQFHAHWGANDGLGSEHKIDGKVYPLELHFVHYSKRYNNLTEALEDPQGLAVIAVFAEIGEKHLALENIISRFDRVKYTGSNTSDITSFKMADLLPSSTSEFIRYNGSLTTPGYDEIVIWTVLKNPIKVSREQLMAFRGLRHGSSPGSDAPLVNNFRPVQKIGSRTVLRTFGIETTSPPPPSSASTSLHFHGKQFIHVFSVILSLGTALVQSLL